MYEVDLEVQWLEGHAFEEPNSPTDYQLRKPDGSTYSIISGFSQGAPDDMWVIRKYLSNMM